MLDCLDFERPLIELENKIQALREATEGTNFNIKEEIRRLTKKHKQLTASIFSSLTPHQIVQLARHPKRPYSQEYIPRIFEDFQELHGDRHSGAGHALIGGIGRLMGHPVMVLGNRKGRNVKEKLRYNFGMPKPASYRKAKRLLELAGRFGLPVFTFIDTPGAYPGVEAEERNQSEAIARNLLLMSRLPVPIICTVIGEGGSGGALAIGVGDRLLMLEYATYSVISPEGCASILWKEAEKAKEAAEAMGLTAKRLMHLGLIDEILPEPLGSAYRDMTAMSLTIKSALIRHLDVLKNTPTDALLEQRYTRLRHYGLSKNR